MGKLFCIISSRSDQRVSEGVELRIKRDVELNCKRISLNSNETRNKGFQSFLYIF